MWALKDKALSIVKPNIFNLLTVSKGALVGSTKSLKLDRLLPKDDTLVSDSDHLHLSTLYT